MADADKQAPGKTVPVELLYDTWLQDDVRIPAGSIVDIELDLAKALIAEGKATRADPLPGDSA